MKKGINIWSFGSGKSIKDCMLIARDAGFDGIELALDETGELNLESSEKEILDIRKIAEDTNIDISSLATGLYWSYPLTGNSSATREKGAKILKKQIEMAAILGVDAILVVPGAVGVDFMSGADTVEYDVAYDRALEAISKMAPYAEKYKICIGIENVWNKFLLSPLEMRDFIDKIGSKYVGAYLDVGNVLLTGYPEHWIKILGKRIKKVHFKDYKKSVGSIAGFVDLLSGDVNYPAVVKGLKEAGYEGYVIAEMIPPYQHYPEQIIYNTSKSMDRILERR